MPEYPEFLRDRFLLDLETAVRNVRDPGAVLAHTCEALGRALAASRVGYARLADQGRVLVVEQDWTDGSVRSIVGRYRFEDFGADVTASHRRGETYVFSNLDADPRLAEQRDLFRQLGLIAVVTVPLMRQGELVGVLSVHHAAPRHWREDEIGLIEEVGHRTWSAFEHALALARLRDAERAQAFLLRLGDQLRPLDKPAEVLETAAAELGAWLGANRVGYAEVEADGEHFVVDAGEWTDGSVAANRGRWKVTDFGEAAEILRRGELQVIEDVASDARIDQAHRAAFEAMSISAIMTVPLIKDGRFTAMMSAHSSAPRVWTEAEVGVLESVAQRTWAELQRVRAEIDLARSLEALHQSEKIAALGSLLAGVSHELNNPLSIVVAHAMLLEEDVRGSEHAESAAAIRRAAERCGRIVQTFLAMARQRPPVRTRVAIADVLAAALELTGYGLRTGGIEVSLESPPGLPHLEADPDQLQQVFANLIVNAQQAMQGLDGPRRLRIAASSREGALEIEVSDTGPGVPPDLRRRIFEPFFTTKPLGSGTGVGLSFSAGLVESHGGRLELVERDTPGAAFRVTLPLPGAEVQSTAVASEPMARADRRGRALIVEDEPDVGAVLGRIVEREGFAATVVEGATAAREALSQDEFDVILSDLQMAQGGGRELHAWIAETHPALLHRLGFITGDTLGGDAGAFLKAAGRPVVEKPFTPNAIAALIDQLRSKVPA